MLLSSMNRTVLAFASDDFYAYVCFATRASAGASAAFLTFVLTVFLFTLAEVLVLAVPTPA
jgi:hypothetical protein